MQVQCRLEMRRREGRGCREAEAISSSSGPTGKNQQPSNLYAIKMRTVSGRVSGVSSSGRERGAEEVVEEERRTEPDERSSRGGARGGGGDSRGWQLRVTPRAHLARPSWSQSHRGGGHECANVTRRRSGRRCILLEAVGDAAALATAHVQLHRSMRTCPRAVVRASLLFAPAGG